MSTFGVTVEKLSKVWPHPNADKLDLGSLEGMDYQFVLRRGAYKTGDLVVYFPVDSQVPPAITDLVGLTGKLGGKQGQRVRTIKLRKEVSQGLVLSQDDLKGVVPADKFVKGTDLTELLGVTKFDEEEHTSGPANRVGGPIKLPPYLHRYDIESCQKFAAIVDELMDEPCYIAEKLEGSHCSLTFKADDPRKIILCSRGCTIPWEPVKKWYTPLVNWFKTKILLKRLPVFEKTWYHWAVEETNMVEKLKLFVESSGCSFVTIRGEAIGPAIQRNIYELPKITLRVFDIEIDGTPVDARELKDAAGVLGIELAPQLAYNQTLREFIVANGGTLVKAASGPSAYNPKVLREGIVIRPMKERTHPKLGRLQLKYRDPEYLAWWDGK